MRAAAFCLVCLAAAVCAQEKQPIWYHYRTTLLPNEDAMYGVYQCLTKTKICTELETEVKEVFESKYLDNCNACCSFRQNMVREINQYFVDHSMAISDRDMMNYLRDEQGALPDYT